MINKTDIMLVAKDPVFRAGLFIQCLSAFLIAMLVLAIKMGGIDIIGLAFENGIDAPSPRFDALYWGTLFVVDAFILGFALYALAFHRRTKQRKAHRDKQPHR